MSWTNMRLGSFWEGQWPEYVDVIAPSADEHVAYVPLMPWDGKKYHCIYCGAELHGYLRRCSCGKLIYGYEDNGSIAVLDAAELEDA